MFASLKFCVLFFALGIYADLNTAPPPCLLELAANGVDNSNATAFATLDFAVDEYFDRNISKPLVVCLQNGTYIDFVCRREKKLIVCLSDFDDRSIQSYQSSVIPWLQL
jgi:hypothetical protein